MITIVIFQVSSMRIKMNQEPLGVAPGIVQPQDLIRWADISPPHYLTDYSSLGESNHATSPFPFDPELNHKIILW